MSLFNLSLKRHGKQYRMFFVPPFQGSDYFVFSSPPHPYGYLTLTDEAIKCRLFEPECKQIFS